MRELLFAAVALLFVLGLGHLYSRIEDIAVWWEERSERREWGRRVGLSRAQAALASISTSLSQRAALLGRRHLLRIIAPWNRITHPGSTNE